MKSSVDSIRIILADDHEVLRAGIGSILQKHTHIKIVAEAADGLQLIELTNQFIPDVILTDIKMPLMNGIEATRIIAQKYPQIGIIALSMYDDDKLILSMLEAGAKGYLEKNAGKDEIVEAINTVKNLDSYFCKNISLKMMRLVAESRFGNSRQNRVELSLKEKQVIELICRQFFTKEISEALHLSPRTIEGYRESILKKISARNTAGIVIFAIANKLYEPSDADIKNR